MPAETLTERAIRALRPGPKPYKRFDGRGLYLAGCKLRRLQYRAVRSRDGRRVQQVLALGRYGSLADEVKLKLAPCAGRGVGRKAALGAARGTAGAADLGALAAGAREYSRHEPSARRYQVGTSHDRGEWARRQRTSGASADGWPATIRTFGCLPPTAVVIDVG